jgi:hypothetical protein
MSLKHRLRAVTSATVGFMCAFVALNSASLAFAAPPHQSSGSAGGRPVLAVGSGQLAGAALYPATGKLRLTGAAHFLAPAAPASTGSDCYVKTEKNRKFKGYRPWHNTEQGKSFIIDWLNQLYSISDARFLQNEGKTYQVQFCSVGGGNTSHGWHQWFNGNALFYQAKSDHKIKWIWGTGTSSDGGIKTALSFSVAKGPVNIGASTTVTTGVGSYLGTFGEDDAFGSYPKSAKKYDLNRVNTYFLSPHNHIWDGTAHFEGNTGQVVYEWSMSYIRKHAVYFSDVVGIAGLCGELFGRCSKPFQ